MRINTPAEHKVAVTEDASYIASESPAANDRNTAMYDIECPDGYVIGVEAGTLVAPEIYDANGDEIDDSSRIIIQKADQQGQPLSNGIVYDGLMSDFDYSKMRNDPDFIRETRRGVVLNERQHLYVYIVTPSGADAPDAGNSHVQLGDSSTALSRAVSIREKATLPEAHRKAVDANSR